MAGRRHVGGRRALVAAVICCLWVAPLASAQSKNTAKQAESLEKSGESAKVAVQGLLDHLAAMLAGYNSIVGSEAKNPQSAYKKLVGDLNATGKMIDGAKKQLAALNKEAEKFFTAWAQDLASMSSDSLREKSAGRLESARSRYASLGETLTTASEELAPVVQSLNDQILFLGRDLSPEAIADLQDEAAELNRQAAEAREKIQTMLRSAAEAQHQAEAALDEEGLD